MSAKRCKRFSPGRAFWHERPRDVTRAHVQPLAMLNNRRARSRRWGRQGSTPVTTTHVGVPNNGIVPSLADATAHAGLS